MVQLKVYIISGKKKGGGKMKKTRFFFSLMLMILVPIMVGTVNADDKIVLFLGNEPVEIDKSHPEFAAIHEILITGALNISMMECALRLGAFYEGKRAAEPQIAQCSEVLCRLHKEMVERGIASLQQVGAICHGSAEMYSELGNRGKSTSLFVFSCEKTGYTFSCGLAGMNYLSEGQPDKARIYLKKACNRESSQSQQDKKEEKSRVITCGLLSSVEFDSGNYAEALTYAREACPKGSADACKTLGYAYSLGRGVMADEKQAMMYFRRACALGLDEVCEKK
jgi:TPR repeat protein